MTTELAERRKRRALTLAIAAGALAAVAAVTVGIDARSSRQEAGMGAVLPRLEEQIAAAEHITVQSADATYQIERVQRGEERVWVMRDRGDYPVTQAALDRFTRGLRELQYVRRMTSDPSKFDRLGVTDPREGGRGVLVQVERGDSALIVDLIVGVEPNGGLYVRKPNENQTWAVRGELPPLRDAASWLDLNVLDLAPEDIVRVEITPREGPAYIVMRNAESGDFAIVSPRVEANVPYRLAAMAERITRLEPIDVQTAPAIQGPSVARIRVITVAGLAIEADQIESEGRIWTKIVARASAPEQEEGALAINSRVAEWAYALRPEDAAALAPPLNTFTGE